MITGVRCAASRRNGLCGSVSLRKALFGTAADTCEDTLRLSTAVAQQALQSFTSRMESCTIDRRYDLGPEIGRGRFGRVQEAVCKETGEALAVKSIPVNRVYDLQMLEREIDISNSINHKNCMRTVDTLVNRTHVHLVTEKMEGEELFERIINTEGYAFTEEETAVVMHQVLEAVEYLHLNNISHRDIKPENIMFEDTDSWELSLIDFGMASKFDPLCEAGSLSGQAGSPSYVAPEVLDPGTYNHKADLWSCGVIMYILLSGSSPFTGESVDATMETIKSGDYNLEGEEWDNISCEAKEVVRRLLVVDPAERACATEAKSLSFFSDFNDTNAYVLDDKTLNDYYKVWCDFDFNRTSSRTFA